MLVFYSFMLRYSVVRGIEVAKSCVKHTSEATSFSLSEVQWTPRPQKKKNGVKRTGPKLLFSQPTNDQGGKKNFSPVSKCLHLPASEIKYRVQSDLC